MSPAVRRLVLAVTTPMAVNVLLEPQLAALTAAGWEVHVVCSPGAIDDRVRAAVCEVHQFPMIRSVSPARDLSSITRMVRLLRRLQPKIVVGSTPKAGFVSMVGARIAGVPVRVFQVRGARWEGESGMRAAAMRSADRAAAGAATHLLAVSESLADLLIRSGVTRRRPTVLGDGGSKGVDLGLFHPDPGYVFDPAAPRLGFAGRLSVDKGVGELVDVLSRIERVLPGVRLEIAGDVDAAQPIDPILAHRLGGDPAITLLGSIPQPELAARMRRWDLLVFPSLREGMPNVVIESAACGAPAVAWDVTGVRDAIDSPAGGRLVRFGDAVGFAAAAIECLDPACHAGMREHATRWTSSRFDAQRLQRLFVDFLDDASAGAGRRVAG